MEHATHNPTLEVINQESPEDSNPVIANTALSQAEAATRPAPNGYNELPKEKAGHPDFAVGSTPPHQVTETVPDSIVAAEFGTSPHCLPPRWHNKAPAP